MRQAHNQMSIPTSIKALRLMVVAVCGATALSSLLLSAPAGAQLPPVNMGRWVHQPGDNQYSTDTQQQRHGGGPAPVVNVPVNIPLATPGWRPTPKPRRDDISLLPVVCDEPVPPAGFPPMPDQLDLPGIRGGSIMRGAPSMGGGNFSSSYGGVGGGGGSVQIGGGMPAGAGEVRQSQGYTTTAPGAFVQRKTPYGRANNGGGGDVYASGDGAAPVRSSAAQDALRRLGKEPSLDDKGRTAAPEAPSAVQVNQATSQDLSLPDDEMQLSGRKSSSQGSKIFNRTIGRMGNRMLNQINSMPLPIKMPTGH